MGQEVGTITPSAPAEAAKKRGFARMSAQQQRAIASRGGKSAHATGKAHRWTRETARAAANRRVEKAREKASQA